MGASAAAGAALGQASSGPAGPVALCGLHPVLLEVFLEHSWPCDWVTKQHTSGLEEDVGARDVMVAVGEDVAALHSLGRLLSGHEPLGLEIDVARQGSCQHRLPNQHWVAGPAGEVGCLQGWPGSSWATWKEGRHMIPEVESVDAVAAASAGL